MFVKKRLNFFISPVDFLSGLGSCEDNLPSVKYEKNHFGVDHAKYQAWELLWLISRGALCIHIKLS